eukprot:9145663-Heterocapsa_arctica.AAC.1
MASHQRRLQCSPASNAAMGKMETGRTGVGQTALLGKHQGQQRSGTGTVSYTHLTLPTNREV